METGEAMAELNSDFPSEAESCIVEAFLALYATEPAEKISVQDVVQRSGYSRGTFYRKFESIPNLLKRIEDACTCTAVCQSIIERAATIPLEDATDQMAAFYQQRAGAVRVLLEGSNGNDYLARQIPPMRAMFAALLKRAYNMTPLQLDVASNYIAAAKAGMVKLWVERGQVISLDQINKMSENLVESNLWTFVAEQAPAYGGPHEKRTLQASSFDYPWRTANNAANKNVTHT